MLVCGVVVIAVDDDDDDDVVVVVACYFDLNCMRWSPVMAMMSATSQNDHPCSYGQSSTGDDESPLRAVTGQGKTRPAQGSFLKFIYFTTTKKTCDLPPHNDLL